MAEKMAIFAVDGNEIFRLDELEDEFLFFLAGVAGDVNRAGGIVVIDERAAAEHVVEHAEDGFFVAGNDARGKDDAVVFVDGDEAVIVDGDARKRGHRFGLAAAGENDDALGIEVANVLRADDHAVGNAQVIHGVRDFDVVDHAAADESDFAADASSDVDHLLNAMDGGSETGKDDAARRGTAEFFDARDDGALGRSEAGALDVGGIAEKSEDAFGAVAGEGVEIEGSAVDGSLVDLEVAGVNDDAERRANGKCDAVNGAVRDGDEFDFVGADFDETAGHDFAKGGGLEEAGFFEAFFYEGESEARAVNGDVQVAQNVSKRADVVFVAVREDDGANVLAVLFQVGDVGDDEVNAEEFGFGEHHAGVDDENVVTETKDHHVHAKFAETAERDC